jgi:hypothetical protein
MDYMYIICAPWEELCILFEKSAWLSFHQLREANSDFDSLGGIRAEWNDLILPIKSRAKGFFVRDSFFFSSFRFETSVELNNTNLDNILAFSFPFLEPEMASWFF